MGIEKKPRYKVIGLMSGTSMDGVDVVSCFFQKKKNDQWKFRIEKAITIPYTATWRAKLSAAYSLPGKDLIQLHTDYGLFLGGLCKKFIRLYDIKDVDFIASHGHTVLHQPEKKFTFQLGDGNAIHAESKLPVVYDFRSLDVVLGGQGAPLVPLGDQFLFSEFDTCLNIGGIANLSQQAGGKRVAFDICFANMGLNHLAQKAGREYDKHGALASDGKLNTKMLTGLKKVYAKLQSARPSLGRELFEQRIQPILDQEKIILADRLHTFTESIASEIASVLNTGKKNISVLCTGGGAFNSYLLNRMVELCNDRVSLIVPDEEIVKFKEAVVFAFLGIRRVRNEINCLRSVTRATHDCSGGLLIGF